MTDIPRVLMVDDEADYCAMIGRRLAGLFNFTFALTIADGIRQMEEREPDAVLLDLSLPDSEDSPAKTLAHMKLHRNHAAIVILSGNPDPDLVYELIRNNASGFLLKDKDDQDRERMASEINKAIASQRFCAKMAQTSKPL